MFLQSKIATNTHNIIILLCKYFFVSFIICRLSAVSLIFFWLYVFWIRLNDWKQKDKNRWQAHRFLGHRQMFMCCCFLLVNVPVYFVVVWYECMQTVELYGRYHFLAIPIRICCNFSEKIQIKLIFQWTVAKNNIPIPWIDLSNGKICMNCANKHQLTFPLPQPLKYSCGVWWYILMRQFNLYLFR